ncbi:myosin phosphatase Rho-interacting protein isoform X2 [Antechinus flavipes]|uniref:myosin phosphatase Rho-interacting protein isoform X2 n=1 Tax=Antechinus flavipes TaxID=38775 RepID=UPI0022367782|nr:myosin phosphatase Rho-interacting protein isoform X2 [Antechinus flavipes]XP_051853423.1 myosin phosphatase Rho-interacting protein isoform X2 [Antechinus flavipes]
MSAKENPCRKFQANIFNKSKCQNCFKPRESHLLNDEDLNQAKPIYGGWLLLAPEGTDFDNPVHRSRKWQRRFFILYEHGLLRYALDEMPTTLPQGTINMNQCTDVVDGESRTGQKFSLCILTPEKEHFIRAENKEIISGWLEMLIVYPRTNKQNQKKKRKVEPPTPQEPGPAKMAVTSSNIPSAEKIPTTKSTLWQEEIRGKDQPDGSTLSPVPSSASGQVLSASSLKEPGLENKEEESTMNGDRVDCGRKARVESGYFSLEKTKQDLKAEEQQLAPPSPPSPSTPNNRYSYPELPFQEHGRPFSSPGPQPAGRIVYSISLNSLDSASRPPTPTDSSDAGGREAEKPGRLFAFKASRQYTALADVPKAIRISNREAFQVERRRLERRIRARSPGREEVARLFGNQRRRSQVIEKFEALDIEKAEHMETNLSAGPMLTSDTRQGRSEKRVFPRKRDSTTEAIASPVGSIPDVSASPLSPHRRAKSLDRRSTESSMTPDLLNFKKGWLTKQYEDGQWKKHWFVLADQSLRYYRDSVAEEAADLDGEIDLSTCCNVTEYPVQRNYGFQIHTKEGEFTLSAMTSGIRRNWIQTIMKHVHPTTAPDVTSSLPEEKNKTSSSFETCPKPSEKQDVDQAELDPEQKRSRARERRREGRSKTFDWAEFRPIQQALAQERASAVDSCKTREPGSSEMDLTDLEKERARRREERRKRFEMLDSVDGPSAEDALLRMEVDRSPVSPVTTELKPQNVHVEIEQRWHQVETTPLREEKQVPIAPLHLSAEDNSERLPTQELTSLLEKELEQSQKEASDLLEQNRLLQDQLKVALGREQSAREGYVLQTEVATSPSGAWQRLHKVNQDLQSELETQCQRQELINHQIQSLKRSYGEAKDIIRHHEVEIQRLQARLSNAAAELSIKEQALAKLKNDLKMEKEKVTEQLEEWQQSESTLSFQLRVSEQQLRSAEALLLEKTQELRDLEMQQALHRDHQKEVQRLQDRIADLSQQLGAREQAQALMEEKLQKNYELLLESCEKEKQALLQNLKEVEDKACEYEDQLQDHEQQMEILQKEKLSAKFEGSELVHQLEEQLEVKEASIQKLAEHIRSLQEERDEIKQRFSELMNQVAESDHKVAKLQEKLKSWEVDYQTLEQSYQKVLDQFQGMHTVLKEKEEELKHIKEMHEKILEKKDQDLHEALVKMAALGGSLEETEMKLFQVKEELLRKAADSSTKDGEEPGAQLDVQEDSPVELGPNLHATGAPLASYHVPLQNEEAAPKELCGELLERGLEDALAPLKSAEPPDQQGHQKALVKPDGGAPGAKRQRIRFSSIQCQKYIHPEGSEKNWTSSTSSDTSQDRSLSEESMSSEPVPSCLPSGVSDPETYISIIHSLETKLYITEEKLKDVTMKLESQQGQNQETLIALHHQWAGTESQLHEQLQASLSQVGALVSQLEKERQEKLKLVENHVGELGDFQIKNTQALTCLEKCREQLRSLPKVEKEQEQDLCMATLASLETTLSNAIQVLHHLPSSSNGLSQASLGEGSSLNEGQSTLQIQPQILELTEQEQLRLLSQRIAFEASLINQIAESLKNASSDISHILQEIYLTAKVAMEPTHVVNTATTLADSLSKKLILEGEFWNQVEELSKHLVPHREEEANKSEADHFNFPQDLVTAVADATLIRAELGLTAQSMRESFYQKLESIEDNLNRTRIALRQHKCMLGEILKSYRTPDFERVMQQISEAFGFPDSVTGDVPVTGGWSSSEMLPCPDSGGSPESPALPGQSNVALNEQIAQQLKDRARVLEEVASALVSLPALESMSDCQQLLKASQRLSYFSCLNHLGHYSSLLVQDAIIQAQVCYSVCKMRLEYERELKFYKESWKNSVDASFHEPTRAIAALRMEYEELLHKQKSEYLEVISIIERENDELKAKVAQLDCQQRCLEEVESKHSESIFALQDRYEEEIRSVVEQLNSTKNTLQAERTRVLSQLDASVKDKQDMERFHVEQMQTLEDKFQLKIKELQIIHEEELRTLQEHYTQNLQCLQETLNHYQRQNPEVPPSTEPQSIHHIWPTDQLDGAVLMTEGEPDSMTGLRERIQELEAKMNVMREELEHKDLEGNASTLREKYQKDFENLKATCERGFAAMEETHQKKIEDLQRQHQRELEKLREEKDRLLAEETAATISAIEAMKNAHREEMERELEKTHRSQISSVNSDIEALRRQYLEELQSVQRELEVLSEQYSQKCLENAHLAQALEAERQALRQCQRENQELNAHNQELNNRLAAEITRLRTLLTGEGGGEAAGSPLTQGKDAYELEVLLRVKESEIQYLKQEISSLKDELQTALRDKKYASDKYKDIYTELSIVKAKADCDISKLKEQLKAATEALGEKSPENTTVSGYDIMKSKSNPDFLKKDRSSVSRQLRNIRSKSVIEQVSWDN